MVSQHNLGRTTADWSKLNQNKVKVLCVWGAKEQYQQMKNFSEVTACVSYHNIIIFFGDQGSFTSMGIRTEVLTGPLVHAL